MCLSGAGAAGAVTIRDKYLVDPLEYLLIGAVSWAVAGRYDTWMNTSLVHQARKFPLEEQLELVEALWDSFGDRNAVAGPTDAQKAELNRRLADSAANPEEIVPWDEVKESALTRIGRSTYRFRLVVPPAQSSSKQPMI